jgi:hypothetical protein
LVFKKVAIAVQAHLITCLSACERVLANAAVLKSQNQGIPIYHPVPALSALGAETRPVGIAGISSLAGFLKKHSRRTKVYMLFFKVSAAGIQIQQVLPR